MSIDKIFAQIACADLAVSTPWYSKLFAREPDATPMNGLAEWHHGDAGLQLFQQPDNAGHTTLTLVVSDLDAQYGRLADAGLDPDAIEAANYVDTLQLRDPDSNLVVLAQPRA